MDPLALILVYKYLYRNERCPRTTHLLLLLMPAVGIYTASAICCHCRCGSCVTTYFNIVFFLLLCCYFRLLDVHSFAFFNGVFRHSPVILSSFQQIYFSFCYYSVLPYTMSVFYLLAAFFVVFVVHFFLSFSTIFFFCFGSC